MQQLTTQNQNHGGGGGGGGGGIGIGGIEGGESRKRNRRNRERSPPSCSDDVDDAPPKQVAVAMERLSQAARLIAHIRIGADRLLESLFVAASSSSSVASPTTQSQSQQQSQSNNNSSPSSPSLHLILKEEASMRRHLQLLRTLGKQLEDSGVLSGSLRSRSHSWGLHMPLVCPDGAVVAYAWKRQLAGQAGASAVDRTRLALKAFTDQKRRFFPHLQDDLSGQISGGDSGFPKRNTALHASPLANKDDLIQDTTLPATLMCLGKEAPNIRIFTYQRLDWLKRASSLANENSVEQSREDSIHDSSRLTTASFGVVATDQVAVVELWAPSTFRAIVSLHPAGSVDPDAVAVFSPDEGGSYVHSRGHSVYHVFRHITEQAVKALQYFLGTKKDRALYHILDWICSYQTLFTKVCSKCERLLTLDKPSSVLLPPIHRPYHHSNAPKMLSTQSTLSMTDESLDVSNAYHIGCCVEEA